jgi:Zn finger protein HypA/HybF involved in hydrogenase expression
MSRKIGKGVITRYKCNDCDSVISEEDIILDKYTQLQPCGEEYVRENVCEVYCPHCDSMNVEVIF